jgi:hypothetical protein
MIELHGRGARRCDGQTRRDLLRAGALGLAGLTLPDWLRLRADGAGAADSGRSVIVIWLDGGPPQHETYDPKPEAPSDFRGPLGAIGTRVPGVQLAELLPRHAALMDKIALIRSMHHDNGDHFAAAHWMLTGHHGSNAVNMAPTHPSVGSVASKLKGPRRPGLPAYVGLPHTHSVGLVPGYHGAAYLGRAFDPFTADGDPNGAGYQAPNLTLPGGLDAMRLDNRRALHQAFDAANRELDAGGEELDRFEQEAFALLTSPEARRAFDLSREDPRLRDRYGRHQWGQSALVARRLVEAGVRFVTLTFGGWDFHSNLERGMKSVLPVLDAAVATLIDDLDRRGRLGETLVLVMGEFGRTPKINQGLPQDPVPGRDHWGNVMSVLAAGGGVRGGRVVGASNARGEVPRERPTTPADLVATMYYVLGIDPETTFNDRLKRPIPIVPQGGAPIRELF